MHNFYSYPPPNIQPAHHFGGLFFWNLYFLNKNRLLHYIFHLFFGQ